MSKWMTIEEYHVSFAVTKASVNSKQALRALSSRSFLNRLRTSIRSAVGRYPSLRSIRVTVSR